MLWDPTSPLPRAPCTIPGKGLAGVLGRLPPGFAHDTIDEGGSPEYSIRPSSHTVVLGGARRNPWMART